MKQSMKSLDFETRTALTKYVHQFSSFYRYFISPFQVFVSFLDFSKWFILEHRWPVLSVTDIIGQVFFSVTEKCNFKLFLLMLISCASDGSKQDSLTCSCWLIWQPGGSSNVCLSYQL